MKGRYTPTGRYEIINVPAEAVRLRSVTVMDNGPTGCGVTDPPTKALNPGQAVRGLFVGSSAVMQCLSHPNINNIYDR